jgi:hypothetical protein
VCATSRVTSRARIDAIWMQDFPLAGDKPTSSERGLDFQRNLKLYVDSLGCEWCRTSCDVLIVRACVRACVCVCVRHRPPIAPFAAILPSFNYDDAAVYLVVSLIGYHHKDQRAFGVGRLRDLLSRFVPAPAASSSLRLFMQATCCVLVAQQ